MCISQCLIYGFVYSFCSFVDLKMSVSCQEYIVIPLHIKITFIFSFMTYHVVTTVTPVTRLVSLVEQEVLAYLEQQLNLPSFLLCLCCSIFSFLMVIVLFVLLWTGLLVTPLCILRPSLNWASGYPFVYLKTFFELGFWLPLCVS